MRLSRYVAWISYFFATLLATGAATAQDYPHKTIRILTSAIGGGNDFNARLVAQGITGAFGQSVVVENRGGGLIAIETAARATPDGYTLLAYGSNLWLGTILRKLSYEPKDFSPILAVASSPNILVVHPTVAATSVKELIALAKAKPGVLNYASGQVTSSNNMAAQLFKSMAGVDIVRIPYKGGGPALNDLLAGQVQLMFSPTGPVGPHVKSGKLRALAVTSAKPSPLAPGLPTVAASGLPGYELVSYDGFFAPVKTPVTIIKRLNQELVRFLKTAETKERLLIAGLEVVGSTPEEFAAIIKSDTAMWQKKFKEAGITADD